MCVCVYVPQVSQHGVRAMRKNGKTHQKDLNEDGNVNGVRITTPQNSTSVLRFYWHTFCQFHLIRSNRLYFALKPHAVYFIRLYWKSPDEKREQKPTTTTTAITQNILTKWIKEEEKKADLFNYSCCSD